MNASDRARLNTVPVQDGSGAGREGDPSRGVGTMVEAAITANNNAFTPSTGTLTVTGDVTVTGLVTAADVTATDDLTTADLFVTGDTTLGTSKTVAFTTSLIFKDAVGGNTMFTITDSGTTGTTLAQIVQAADRVETSTVKIYTGNAQLIFNDQNANEIARLTDEGTTGSFRTNSDGRVVSGMGTGTARPSLIGVVLVDSTAVASATAGPNDLITATLPANSLIAASRGLRITAGGTTTNNADAKTLTLNFGGQEVLTQAMTVNEANTWEIEAIVLRTGASTQDVFAKVTQLTGTALRKGTFTAGTQTETAAIIIKCTATEEITQEFLLVEAL